MPYENAMLYATGIVILNACNALLMSNALIKGLHNALKVRTAICSVIYRKVIKHFIYFTLVDFLIKNTVRIIQEHHTLSSTFSIFQSLRLSHTAFGETAPGKVVNLLSNDVGRFDYASILVNALWMAPLLTLIIGVLLWQEIGWAGVIGIMIVFVIVPIQSVSKQKFTTNIFRMIYAWHIGLTHPRYFFSIDQVIPAGWRLDCA